MKNNLGLKGLIFPQLVTGTLKEDSLVQYPSMKSHCLIIIRASAKTSTPTCVLNSAVLSKLSLPLATLVCCGPRCKSRASVMARTPVTSSGVWLYGRYLW